MSKDFIKIQKDIANEKIEVIEGIFIGVVAALLASLITCVLYFFWDFR